MKGTPKPTWTPQRHAWLRELAKGDRDPGGTEHAKAAYSTRCLGWTAWRRGPGNAVRGREYLTEEGLKVLARWNAGETKPSAKLPRKAEQSPFVTRIGFAMKGATPIDLADWLDFTGQADDMVALLIARAPAARLAIAQRAADQVQRYGSHALPSATPAHLKPCPVKLHEPAPPAPATGECTATPPAGCELQRELREAQARGEVFGADPGIEVGGTRQGPGVPRETAAIEAQQVRAPQYGQRPPASPAASMGAPTMPKGFSACLACSGKGKTGHGWSCQACHGSGKIRRTVPL